MRDYWVVMGDNFASCPLIYEGMLRSRTTGRLHGPLKLFFIGEDDQVGAILPDGCTQIWPIVWLTKLDLEEVIRQTKKGKWINHPHNRKLRKEGKLRFPGPYTDHEKSLTSEAKETLPIRTKKRSPIPSQMERADRGIRGKHDYQEPLAHRTRSNEGGRLSRGVRSVRRVKGEV